MPKTKCVLNYLPLVEYIIEKIRRGEFAAGDKIPSETELIKQFGINRHAVRQALGRVEKMGWTTTFQGKGSYVRPRPPVVSYYVSGNTRFTDNMRQAGQRHQSVLLEWEKGFPTAEEGRNLCLTAGELVYRLEILRYVEDFPVSVTTSVILEEAVPGMERYLEGFYSLYAILENHYHFRPVRIRTVFQAAFAGAKDAGHLKMPVEVPILRTESLMCHPAGYLVEYGIARTRGDMSRLCVEFGSGSFCKGRWEEGQDGTKSENLCRDDLGS